MPTPTVLPRIILIAEKVPSFPSSEEAMNCGVSGRNACWEEETGVALDDPSSDRCFEECVSFFSEGDIIEKVRGVRR